MLDRTLTTPSVMPTFRKILDDDETRLSDIYMQLTILSLIYGLKSW